MVKYYSQVNGIKNYHLEILTSLRLKVDGLYCIFEAFIPSTRENERDSKQSVSQCHYQWCTCSKHPDPTALNIYLNDLENGDIIRQRHQNAISQIATEERNLPAINLEQQSYKDLADNVTHANDLVTAGDVPSSTPATNVVVQNNNILSIHLDNRENLQTLYHTTLKTLLSLFL